MKCFWVDRARPAVAALLLFACGEEQVAPDAGFGDAGLDGATCKASCEGESCAQPCVTLSTLVAELASLDHLARAASAPYQTLQSSSWDRRSTDPSDASESGWFANRDWNHFEREVTVRGRREWVMAEVEGPGAIMRMWSAGPAGTIRIYLDDLTTPVIETRMETLLTGAHPLFPAPFSYVAARGHNFYFPIPFSQRMRVTTDEIDVEPGLYYIVNTRKYGAGVQVESFSEQAYQGAASEIRDARLVLADPATLATTATSVELPVRAFAGEAPRAPFDITAPSMSGGVIRKLDIMTHGASEEALRSSLLVMSFDGMETVRTPVGDFFGTGPGANELSTLALSADRDGRFVSRFPMPFAESASIRIEGDLSAEVRVTLDEWDFGSDSHHFHVGWGSLGVVESQPKRDFDVAHLTGRGTYVGTHLLVVNPINEWWGEGDEKIYVDGDSFPTWFGTGTEDYFGYAHVDLGLFSAPYHAQTRSGVTSQIGHISNLRVHVVDAIRYERELDFDLELWAWVGSEVAMDWVSYWYARGGSNDFAPLMAGSTRVIDPSSLRR